MLEGQSLTLVYRYRPSQAQRQLSERALNGGFYLLCLLVQLVFRILPLCRFHAYLLVIAGTYHADMIVVDARDASYAPVIVTSFGIVFHEHHLRPLLQRQFNIGRIGIVGECSVYLGVISERLRSETCQFALVVGVGEMVMSGQSDVALFGCGMEVRDAPLVKSSYVVSVHSVLAYMVQNVEEGCVLLTIDVFQFKRHILRLAQGIRTEEVRRVVMVFQQRLVGRRHDRSELLKVAYHEQLCTPERSPRVAESAHNIIYCVEQVAPHHRYLVDNQQVKSAQHLLLLFREVEPFLITRLGNVWRQRQLEEGVDGLPTSINGGNTRRCHHHHSFRRAPFHLSEECGLARSRLSC